ncbi:pyruvate kinase [Desulfonispora thiosulfatigenes DSM 11270]|uniref:Pyruvate kinase n=1 Tax=Desulfonispora thiosulfatigenes DSM 11270 TaxID=656914 RepID=A0A1W1UPB6_DESTI|nr:pyruvate kinase [Desulfonispora thiosulfatigenes]SMB82978.1 pyruvate kinase [Desulfonispora thiosulfatigenes DSM 11270]
MKKTKIVCTIGPASQSVETLVELINNGMNVARLNFSHGNYEEHAERIGAIAKAVEITKKPIGIMLDTKGPEIRIGLIKDGKANLIAGNEITLTTDEIEGDESRIFVNYAGLPQDVKPGNQILLDDGIISLEVLNVEKSEIKCKILNSGEISNRKGVNVPDVRINLPSITEKDIADIKFGIKYGVDFISASFIRNAQDVLAIKKILEEENADIDIISKIENRQGVDNIDEILEVSEGIMVARGDLGVEIPTEEVPIIQKILIKKCNKLGKPVITATQMLDSMMRNPRPTRAEASDVANAIFDGTDAIMLSGETAAGKYPVISLQTMTRIAEKTESAINYDDHHRFKEIKTRKTTTDAISHATCSTARDLRAAAIITVTKTGFTARMISKYRPKATIVANTPCMRALTKLSIVWGVNPIYTDEANGTDKMIEQAIDTTLEAGFINNGDLVVVTAGVPVGLAGTTNILKVEVVGQIVALGTGIGYNSVVGKARIVNNLEDAKQLEEGEILVTFGTTAEMVPYMKKAAAVITEEAGITSHAAIVGLNIGVSVIVGIKDARNKFKNGEIFTLDVNRGAVYRGIANVI